jgi:uncharacterized integral membrane protein
MHKFRRLLVALFLLLVFFTSVGFSFLNTTQVSLSLGFWEFSPQPLALWVISAFALGGALGLFFAVGVSSFFKNKMETRKLRKQLATAESQLETLRSSSVKSPK